MGKPYEPNAIIKNDIEFILMQRKPGGYRKPTQKQREQSKIDKSDFDQWFRQIWTIPGASTKNHPAPYPLELASRLVKMFSFYGDTVLDPFCGSGTTMIAAMQNHRNSIGIEIEQKGNDKLCCWVLTRFLEHGRVVDTFKFFPLDVIVRELPSLSLSSYAYKKWQRITEVYAQTK